MADRLRRTFEDLEQTLDPLKVPSAEAASEIAVMREDQRRERRDMGRRQRGAVANRVVVRRLARNDGDARRAKIEFGPATGERRHKQAARDRYRRRGLQRLRAVFRIASGLPDRSDRDDVRSAGPEQHRSGSVAGRSDKADTLLFRRSDALLDDRRTVLAAEAQARNVDIVLEAII